MPLPFASAVSLALRRLRLGGLRRRALPALDPLVRRRARLSHLRLRPLRLRLRARLLDALACLRRGLSNRLLPHLLLLLRARTHLLLSLRGLLRARVQSLLTLGL